MAMKPGLRPGLGSADIMAPPSPLPPASCMPGVWRSCAGGACICACTCANIRTCQGGGAAAAARAYACACACCAGGGRHRVRPAREVGAKEVLEVRPWVHPSKGVLLWTGGQKRGAQRGGRATAAPGSERRGGNRRGAGTARPRSACLRHATRTLIPGDNAGRQGSARLPHSPNPLPLCSRHAL